MRLPEAEARSDCRPQPLEGSKQLPKILHWQLGWGEGVSLRVPTSKAKSQNASWHRLLPWIVEAHSDFSSLQVSAAGICHVEQ